MAKEVYCPLTAYYKLSENWWSPTAVVDSNPKHTIYPFMVKFCTILSLYSEQDENKEKRPRLV